MRKIFTGLHSLFMLSFCLLLFLEIKSQTEIWAGDIDDFDNESLPLLNINNGNTNEILVLNGATLIDGNGGPPISDSVLVIGDNKEIVAVTNQTNFSDNSLLWKNDEGIGSQITKRVLNVPGKYIMPGLFDMHAHVAGVRKNSHDLATSENMLQMLLDYGVTTVRNPGGPTNDTVHLREEIINGNLRGPEMFTAGRLLNTPEYPVPFVEKQVTTEEDVREEVRNQAAAGVDYIKLYVGLKPELVKAAVDEAHMQGIKGIGHLYLTSWTEAANLGIDFLTHGAPVSPSLLPENEQRIFSSNGGGPFDHTLWLNLVNLNNTEIEQRWNKVLQLTKMMHDRGVKILSGTDIPNFELVPGESLHHELELLVGAGINTSDVIKIATKNGAKALEDIKNTKRIDAVISNGEIINR